MVGTGYKFQATSGVLTPAISSPFDVTAGAPTALSFIVQPYLNFANHFDCFRAGVVLGSPFLQPPRVGIVDAYG